MFSAVAPLTFVPAMDECFRCSASAEELYFLSFSNAGPSSHCWGQRANPHLHINLSLLCHSRNSQNHPSLNCMSFSNIRLYLILFHGLLLRNVCSTLCPCFFFYFALEVLSFIMLFAFCFCFRLCPRHVEVPRPGIKLMP